MNELKLAENEVKLFVHRNKTADITDLAGQQKFHEERAKLLQGLISSLDLEVKGGIYDVDDKGRPREVAEVIIVLGSAGVFTAMVSAFRAWLDRNKVKDVEIVGRGGSIKIGEATAKGVQDIAKTVGATLSTT